MNRYICIHGHFYQPPRENPWLEEIELQESAHPYHDWNERITSQCYAPNTASRILGENRKIVNIVNNYVSMSFNFGPTLLSWMQRCARETYQDILLADKESRKKFSGHGAAMAQTYNHMIMPLANTPDERTQVCWGIKDFEARFKRKPEGMWLAETAVNTETLEILAEYGIAFTVLAPHQAARVKKIGEDKWHSVKGGKVDVQMGYVCRLPSGKSINLFFYDGPISQELAFQGLLKNGEAFASRLVGAFPKEQKQPRLVHVATDGETYGHHQDFGDMALAFCVHHLETDALAKVTIYGEFLEKFPPTHEVQILENTSWSCAHGIDRWWTDCGCNNGGHPDWHQKWREPLRNALDWLREATVPLYVQHMSEYAQDPWLIRDRYIEVILDRSQKTVEKFFKQNAKRELQDQEKIKVLKLLEMQRHAMLMYTSCGWFFDEISGIETVQILRYAARVIQLAKEIFGRDFEGYFKGILEHAPSNVPEYQNGAEVYQKLVMPASVDLIRVGAHHAITSLFREYGQTNKIYCYTAANEFYERKEAGKQTMAVGRVAIRSDITWEEIVVSFAVLHLGDHNVNGGARLRIDEGAFGQMHRDMKKAFLTSDIPEVIRLINLHFERHNYSLRHLFKNEQRNIFNEIIASSLKEIEAHFRQIYVSYYPLMQAKDELNISLPRAISTSVEFVLNQDLLDLLRADKINMKRLARTVEEVNRWSFGIDKQTIGYMANKKINILMNSLGANPRNINALKTLEFLLRILSLLPLDLDLWRAQNDYFAISKQLSGVKDKKDHEPSDLPPKWLELFRQVGEYLRVHTD